MRAMHALQACMDEPARSTISQDTLLSITRWMMQSDLPPDLLDIALDPLPGLSANPLVISSDSSNDDTLFHRVDSDIQFRRRSEWP